MHPNPRELLQPAAPVHLAVEEVGHRLVVEFHRGPRACLPDKLHVLDVEQIGVCGDAEAADLRVAQVAEIEQFGPGRGAEAQLGRLKPLFKQGRRRTGFGGFVRDG